MSSTGIRRRRTTDDRTDDTLKQVEDNYIRKAKKFTDQARAETGNVGPAAIGGSSIPGASYLPISGKYGMIGSLAFNPTVVPIIDGRINITPNQSGASRDSSYVLLSGQNIDTLKFIDGASKNGQIIFLQGTQTQIHTVRAATIPSISLISGLVTVTVVTTNNHNLTTSDKINILGTNNFNINNVDVTVIDPTTFTYLALGNVVSESAGTVQDGNFITETGDDVILDGTKAPHGTGIIPIIFDPTIIGNGAWRPAQTLTAGGGGGDVSFPILYLQDDFGDQSLVTLNMDISGNTGQNKTVRMTGDIGFEFTSPPGSTVLEEIWVTFEQDEVGGHSITSTPTGLKNEAVLDTLLDKNPNAKTTFHFITEDGGVTFRGELVDFVTVSGDNLGNHIATQFLQMNNNSIFFNANPIFNGQVVLSLETRVGNPTFNLEVQNFSAGDEQFRFFGVSDFLIINEFGINLLDHNLSRVNEIDFDGSVAKIQGLHEIEFNLSNTSIDDLSTDGLDYKVESLQRHLFKSPNGIFLVLDEVNTSDRRIDAQQNPVTNIGKLQFTGTFNNHTAGISEIFQELDNENIRYESKNGHIFNTDAAGPILLSIGNANGEGGSIRDIGLLNFNSVATAFLLDNGDFQLDGTTMKVVSDSVIRSFSDIIPNAMENDLSNMVAPTVPTVDLSLNTHNLLDVTEINFTNTDHKIIDEANDLTIKVTDSSDKILFATNIVQARISSFALELVNLNLTGVKNISTILTDSNIGSSGNAFNSLHIKDIVMDGGGRSIVNVVQLESNSTPRPGSGFIRMGTADQIRMKNLVGDDDLIIGSGDDAQGNDSIIFSAEGTTVLTVSLLNLDVKDTNIISTGDIFPRGQIHTIGDETDYFTKMHSDNFIPESSSVDSDIFGLAKFGNTLYVNFDDANIDAGFGIFEQGIEKFLFSIHGASPFVNELTIGGDPFLTGEEYRIQFGTSVNSSARIFFIEGVGNDLILDRSGAGIDQGVQIRGSGLTIARFLSNEIKIFQPLNANTQDLINVVDIKSDGNGSGTIGELGTADGGFDYFMRSKLTWELNAATFIEMNVNELSVVSDANINILANNASTTDITIRSGAGIIIDALTTTMSLRQGSVESLQFASGVTTFSNADIFLTNGTKFISFLDEVQPATIPNPSAGDISLFNDESSGELSVKKNGDIVISLEASGAGANNTLTNLVDVVRPNKNILADRDGSAGRLGADNADDAFREIFVDSVLFPNQITLTDEKFEIAQTNGHLSYSVPDLANHHWFVNHELEMELNVTELDLKGHDLKDVKDISMTSGISIISGVEKITMINDSVIENVEDITFLTDQNLSATTTGLKFLIPDSQNYEFRVGADIFLTMDNGLFDLSASTTTIVASTTISINSPLISINSDSIILGDADTDIISFFAHIAIAPTYVDGIKQIFSPNSANAGINVGSNAGDPTSAVNGDMFYDTNSAKFRFRENNEWVAFGSGTGGEVPIWTQDHDADGYNFIVDIDGDSFWKSERDGLSDDWMQLIMGGSIMFSISNRTGNQWFRVGFNLEPNGNTQTLGSIDQPWKVEYIDSHIDFDNTTQTTIDSVPPSTHGFLYWNDSTNSFHQIDSADLDSDLLTGGGIEGANQQLDNLSGIVRPNLDIIANQNSGGNLGSATSGEEFFNLFTQTVQFIGDRTVTLDAYMINRNTSPARMIFNVPDMALFSYSINGSTVMDLDVNRLGLSVGIELNGNKITEVGDIEFDDNAWRIVSSSASPHLLIHTPTSPDQTFLIRQEDNDRFFIDANQGVTITGGVVRLEVNENSILAFEGATTSTTIGIANTGSIFFKEATITVASYNGFNNNWNFDPSAGMFISAGTEISLKITTQEKINISSSQITMSGAVVLNNDITVDGDSIFNASIKLGLGENDEITGNAVIARSWIPDADGIRPMGNISSRWGTGFFTFLDISNSVLISGDVFLGDSSIDNISMAGTVTTDIKFNNTSTLDFAANVNIPTGSAIDAIQIKIAGVAKKIKVYAV